MIFDNSEGKHILIAEKTIGSEIEIHDVNKFNILKTVHNEKHKRTSNQTRILEGMDKVYEKLIEFKKRMNSELVVLKDDKITRIKP